MVQFGVQSFKSLILLQDGTLFLSVLFQGLGQFDPFKNSLLGQVLVQFPFAAVFLHRRLDLLDGVQYRGFRDKSGFPVSLHLVENVFPCLDVNTCGLHFPGGRCEERLPCWERLLELNSIVSNVGEERLNVGDLLCWLRNLGGMWRMFE